MSLRWQSSTAKSSDGYLVRYFGCTESHMCHENVKVKSEETGLSAPQPLLYSESVNLLLNQLAVAKSILKITTFHGSWST